MDHSREFMVSMAAESLQQWGKTEWIEKAIERLPKMESREIQISLSATLARGENTSGWHYVIDTLVEKGRDRNTVTMALIHLQAFDGKSGPDGLKIDVMEKLSDLLVLVPAEVRPEIVKTIDQIRVYGNQRK